MRFLISEQEKERIMNLYNSKHNILEQNQTTQNTTVGERFQSATCTGLGKKANCNDTVLKAQIKMNDVCPSSVLKTKLVEDGIWGNNTANAYSVCKESIIQSRQPSTTQSTGSSLTSTATTQSTESSLTSTATTQSTETKTPEIKTVEQAQAAIQNAKAEAQKVKEGAKVTKEMCRTISKAINPVLPFKKGVANQELCDTLRNCFQLEKSLGVNIILRKEEAFSACQAFPPKTTQQPPQA